MRSFTELCNAYDRKPSTQVLRVHEVPASQMDERFLKQPEGSPVIEIVRLRLADSEPVIL